MNPEEVKELSRFIETASKGVSAIVSQVDSLVKRTSWSGPDAVTFSETLWPQHRRKLLHAANQLSELAATASANAEAQIEVSRETATGDLAVCTDLDVAPLLPPCSEDPSVIGDHFKGLSAVEARAVVLSDPELYGNMDGVPNDLRIEANRHAMFEEYYRLHSLESRTPAESEWMQTLERLGANDWDAGRQFLLFRQTEGGGEIAELHGSLDAKNVAILVPGIDSDVESYSHGGGVFGQGGPNLLKHSATPNDTAVISWLGYDAPHGPTDLSAHYDGRAVQEASKLKSFVGQIDNDLNPEQLSIVAHSYGSTVTGAALSTMPPGIVDNAVFMGSPGVAVQDLGQLNVGSLYDATSSTDMIPTIGSNRIYDTIGRGVEGATPSPLRSTVGAGLNYVISGNTIAGVSDWALSNELRYGAVPSMAQSGIEHLDAAGVNGHSDYLNPDSPLLHPIGIIISGRWPGDA